MNNFESAKSYLQTNGFRVGIIVLIVSTFIVFGYRYFSISGETVVTYDFSTVEHPVVTHFEPKGRAKEPEKSVVTGNSYQRIVGDPVYMNLEVPRSFESVDVLVNYKNPDKQYTQFGVILNESPYSVRLAPFEIPVIDDARTDWHVLTGEDAVVLQREPVFDSVDAFLADLPVESAIGTYQADLPITYTDDSYVAADATQTIEHTLRGTHTFVTYIDSETLEASFTVQDQNGIIGADAVVVTVTDSNGTIVDEQRLEDDGIQEDGGSVSAEQVVQTRIEDLARGVYSIRVATSEDVLIKRVQTAQKQFVLKDLVLLDDPEESAVTLYTEADNMRFVSSTLEGIQEVTFDSLGNEQTLSAAEVHSPYTWMDEETGGHLRTVQLEEDNLRLWTRGYFAFTESAHFDPDLRIQTITEFTELQDLDYILYTNYNSPDHKRLESTQQVSLSFDGMAGDRKELKFVMSAPGIDQNGGEITVNDVTFTFKREPFLKRIKQRLWGSK